MWLGKTEGILFGLLCRNYICFFKSSFNYLLLQKCLGIVRRHDSRRSYAKICRKSVRINATFETIFRSFEKRKRRTVNKRVRFISHLLYLLAYYFWGFFHYLQILIQILTFWDRTHGARNEKYSSTTPEST